MNTLTVQSALDLVITHGQDIKMARHAVTTARGSYDYARLCCCVKEHIVLLWGPRILKAIGKDQHSVTNKWSSMRRSDTFYFDLLKETLGSNFKVELIPYGWREFIKVSWK